MRYKLHVLHNVEFRAFCLSACYNYGVELECRVNGMHFAVIVYLGGGNYGS